jgi:hypothetical protein
MDHNKSFDVESSPSCYEAALAVVSQNEDDTPNDSIQKSLQNS